MNIEIEQDNISKTHNNILENVDVVSPENYINEDLIESKLRSLYDQFFNLAADLRKDEDKESLKKEYYQF